MEKEWHSIRMGDVFQKEKSSATTMEGLSTIAGGLMDYEYHMPAEIYADKKISPTAKLVMQRIFTLSEEGKKVVPCNRESFAFAFGCCKRTITKALNDLVDANYILPVKNNNPFDRTRVFKVTEKGLITG